MSWNFKTLHRSWIAMVSTLKPRSFVFPTFNRKYLASFELWQKPGKQLLQATLECPRRRQRNRKRLLAKLLLKILAWMLQ